MIIILATDMFGLANNEIQEKVPPKYAAELSWGKLAASYTSGSISQHDSTRPCSRITISIISINSESLKQNKNAHAYIPQGKDAAQGFYKIELRVTLTKVIRGVKTAKF